jgi:GTP-binding protein HflX
MKELHETESGPKRALLVGIQDTMIEKDEADSLAEELAGLAETLGLEIAAQETVRVRENNPRFGMGTGKARELAEKAAALRADCLVFDGEFSPSRQRNWERLTGISAVDRQELIIQIFASRARTREAELQASLAELSYALPRLSHKYIDLSRQRGGRYGTRGSGETRLETDRRLVEQRIHQLKGELEEVRKHRDTQRKKRKALPSCALVGYTNAGKSSLLNALTGSEVPVEDKLFVTLDAATRRLETENGPLLLIDTVGFIRRLPHTLVDAFRSTLEEAALADVLIHVVDASDPGADRCFRTTRSVLRDLGADRIPIITALNKADRVSPGALEELQKRYAGAVPVSARDRTGLEELIRRAGLLLAGAVTRFRFPPDRHDLAALLHRSGKVLSEQYEEAYIEVDARVEERIAGQLREFLVET